MLDGFISAGQFMLMHPMSFVVLVLGLLWGILFGAIPGLNGIVGVALLIPFTFGMDPISGLCMLGAVYVGSCFGGNISAILFNVPGAPEATTLVFDGYPMAKKGQAGRALGLSLGTSAIGGFFGTLVLILLSPPLADLALTFGPPEYFALAFLGLTAIASIGSKSMFKGLITGFLGLLIATVGMDPLTSTGRFDFGNNFLLTGVSFVPALIGLFAMSEVMTCVGENKGAQVAGDSSKVSTQLPSIKDLWGLKGTLLRSSIIGTFIGILPGVGATTASFIGYSEAVRWSKTPEKFGTGMPEGIAAPSAANNSAAAGAMVPLLALGIPGSATTAVMIGGLTIHGIIPGPMLLVNNRDLVFSVFITMLLAAGLMIFFGIKVAKYFAKVLNIPYGIVGPSILVLCMTGVYTLRNNYFDLAVVLVFGGLGFLLQKLDYPVAPMIIGLVLGPIAEVNLRRGLMLNDYSLLKVVSHPIAAVLLAFSVASLLYGFYGQFKRWRNKSKGKASSETLEA